MKAYGSQLWEAVIRHLNLLEADYFDLEFEDLHGLEVCNHRNKLSIETMLPNIWFKHILFHQSLIHKYNIIEVGSDSKP